ncbi:MAG: methyltransferase [Blastocatellia bacterium]
MAGCASLASESVHNFQSLADKFDFSRYRTLCGVGGAAGLLSIVLARKYGRLNCVSIDVPAATQIAQRKIITAGLSGRVTARAIDFFAEPLPNADVITMGIILHDWNLDKKIHLVRTAFDALPPGGAFIVIENLIDDARRENVFGLVIGRQNDNQEAHENCRRR